MRSSNYRPTPTTVILLSEVLPGRETHFYDVDFGTKDEVIGRLEKFWDNPKKYQPFLYNCETFAREIMTGVPECKQIDNALEMTKIVAEAGGQTLLKMAEIEQKRRVAEEEAKRRQHAAAAAAAA